MYVGIETRTIEEVYIMDAKSLKELHAEIDKYTLKGYTLADTNSISYGMFKGTRYNAKMQKRY